MQVSLLIISTVLSLSLALPSPCPSIFQYKTSEHSAVEFQSWSAVLHLPQTNNYNREYATGLSVDVILDRPVVHLSAHQFDIVSSDSKKFHLSTRNNTSSTHSDLSRVYMTVEFQPNGQIVPLVDEIRLNGVKICPIVTSTLNNGNRQNSGTTSTTRRVSSTSQSTLNYPNTRDRTTERVISLAVNGNGNDRDQDESNVNVRRRLNTNNNNNNNSNSGEAPRSTQPTRNPEDSYSRTTQQVTPRTSFSFRTTSTTPSPYFPGDLHLLFQANGNDRVIITGCIAMFIVD